MIELRGQRLSLSEIVAVAGGQEQVMLSAEARARCQASRAVVEQIVAENRAVTESIPASASFGCSHDPENQ